MVQGVGLRSGQAPIEQGRGGGSVGHDIEQGVTKRGVVGQGRQGREEHEKAWQSKVQDGAGGTRARQCMEQETRGSRVWLGGAMGMEQDAIEQEMVGTSSIEQARQQQQTNRRAGGINSERTKWKKQIRLKNNGLSMVTWLAQPTSLGLAQPKLIPVSSNQGQGPIEPCTEYPPMVWPKSLVQCIERRGAT